MMAAAEGGGDDTRFGFGRRAGRCLSEALPRAELGGGPRAVTCGLRAHLLRLPKPRPFEVLLRGPSGAGARGPPRATESVESAASACARPHQQVVARAAYRPRAARLGQVPPVYHLPTHTGTGARAGAGRRAACRGGARRHRWHSAEVIVVASGYAAGCRVGPRPVLWPPYLVPLPGAPGEYSREYLALRYWRRYPTGTTQFGPGRHTREEVDRPLLT